MGKTFSTLLGERPYAPRQAQKRLSTAVAGAVVGVATAARHRGSRSGGTLTLNPGVQQERLRTCGLGGGRLPGISPVKGPARLLLAWVEDAYGALFHTLPGRLIPQDCSKARPLLFPSPFPNDLQ